VTRAFVLFLSFLAGTAFAQETPLPKNLKIVPPADEVPGSVRAYSGKWVGKWSSDNRDHTLVVERIEGNDVRFIYSLGPGIRLSQKGGFERVAGHIDEKGALRGKLRSGAEVVYRWTGGDKLLAEYSRQGVSARAILLRR